MTGPVLQSIPNRGFAELMTAVLAKGAPFRFQADGGSMSPFLRSGDIVTLVPVAAHIRLGEVVAFHQPGKEGWAVHRVVGRRQARVLLKGDNCGCADGWVEQARIIGRAGCIEHRGRRVRLGLGPERMLIALLSRLGLLRALMNPLRRLLRPFYKRLFA
jgi:signal peptidase I